MENTPTKIDQAREMIAQAQLKLRQVADARRLSESLFGYEPVRLSSETSKRAFPDGSTSEYINQLLEDAMRVGCITLAGMLESEVEQLSKKTSEILAIRSR